MKYKPGDKVKIKTWENMKEGQGPWSEGEIKVEGDYYYNKRNMEDGIVKLNINRILTIKSVHENCYHVKEMLWLWTDGMIECLASDYKEPVPIFSRFEILDL